MDAEDHAVESSDPGRSVYSSQLIATAYHEAGHAVMAIHVGRQIQKVSIDPKKLQTGGQRLGVCEMQKGRSKAAKDRIEDEALILLAGMVAEARFTGQYGREGAARDLAAVGRLLENRVTTQRQFERLERRLLEKAEHILSGDSLAKAIEMVAVELLEKTTVSGRGVRHFLTQAEQHSS